MKEDNNIKLLIASILKLSLKLSKYNESVKDCPVAKSKPKAKPKATTKPKATAKPKANAKSARVKIVGDGRAEFFE